MGFTLTTGTGWAMLIGGLGLGLVGLWSWQGGRCTYEAGLCHYHFINKCFYQAVSMGFACNGTRIIN